MRLTVVNSVLSSVDGNQNELLILHREDKRTENMRTKKLVDLNIHHT